MPVKVTPFGLVTVKVRVESAPTATGLGVTVTYQLLDRLIANGSVAQARDGELSVGS